MGGEGRAPPLWLDGVLTDFSPTGSSSQLQRHNGSLRPRDVYFVSMAFARFELCLSGWRLHGAQARPQLTVSRQNHNLVVTGQAFGARVSVRICMRWCTWLYRWCDGLLRRLLLRWGRSVDASPKCLAPSPPPGPSRAYETEGLFPGRRSKLTPCKSVEA